MRARSATLTSRMASPRSPGVLSQWGRGGSGSAGVVARVGSARPRSVLWVWTDIRVNSYW
jgi:hypothetical protein